MDPRLYILAGTFLFLVVAVVYLLVAIAKARAAAQAPPPFVVGEWPMLQAAPPEVEAAARLDQTFAEPTSGIAAVLSTPLRTGEWRPDADARLPRTSTANDYWDTLIEEESLLVRPSPVRPQPAEDWRAMPEEPVVEVADPVATLAPEPFAPPVAEQQLANSISEQSAPLPIESAGLVSGAEEHSTAQWIDEIVAQLEEESPQSTDVTPVFEVELVPAVESPNAAFESELVAEPVPAPELAPLPMPTYVVELVPAAQPVVPTPAPVAAASAPAPEEVPAPAPAPVAPVPVPVAPAPVTPAPVASTPAPVAPAPVAPTPAPVVPAPVAPAPAPVPARPVAVVPQAPVPPAPEPARPSALEQVTARADAVPKPSAYAPAPTVPVAPAPVPQPPSAAHDAPGGVQEHELVAPVEMWFGEVRIGVKAGTRTYDRFQKIAQVLFDDLKRASSAV